MLLSDSKNEKLIKICVVGKYINIIILKACERC